MLRTATCPTELLLIILMVPFVQCGKSHSEAPDDGTFQPILTAATIGDWEGDPDYWNFDSGILTGEITPQNILTENTFFIWTAATVDNFELKAEYRITSSGNSGINYRSGRVDGKPYGLRGYQADIDGANRYSGQVYEENGRAILARPGQFTYVGPDNDITEMGALEEPGETAASLADSTWNEYHLVIRGNTLIHLINGRVVSMTIDDGSRHEKGGLLGLQLHRGPPMKIEFRNIRLKEYDR